MENEIFAAKVRKLDDEIKAYQQAIRDAEDALNSAEQELDLLLEEGGFIE